MSVSECPECVHHFTISPSLGKGDQFKCPECGSLLRVVKTEPPVFEIVEKSREEGIE